MAIQNYISPKKRAKFLSVIQSEGGSDDNLLDCFKEARYCDFEKLKRAANPEEELVKIKLMRFEGP